MKSLILILLLFSSFRLQADIAVIGNLKNELSSMTKKEVKNIFMGRTRLLPNGSFALPLDHPELRASFYQSLTNRSIELINAYWARVMFSGQASPPLKLPNSQAIINVVKENKGALGYINTNDIDENVVKILLILK
ncbi:MAG: hypothetical protein KAH20_14975 [Methylococcales bacterium]|nr:hypothetical protein [Methylococcales bacterium]